MKKIKIEQGEYTLEEIQKMFEKEEILKYHNGAVVEALEKEQHYFCISDCSEVGFSYFYNDDADKYRLLTRNVFLTEEEAEKEAKRRKRYYEIINEIDRINREEIWVADWNDDDKAKESLYYDCTNNRFFSETAYSYRQNAIYMCKKAIDWVMNLPDEDKKILIGIYD